MYEIYDQWADKIVETGLSQRAAWRFVKENEPPFNPQVGARYWILPAARK